MLYSNICNRSIRSYFAYKYTHVGADTNTFNTIILTQRKCECMCMCGTLALSVLENHGGYSIQIHI